MATATLSQLDEGTTLNVGPLVLSSFTIDSTSGGVDFDTSSLTTLGDDPSTPAFDPGYAFLADPRLTATDTPLDLRIQYDLRSNNGPVIEGASMELDSFGFTSPDAGGSIAVDLRQASQSPFLNLRVENTPTGVKNSSGSADLPGNPLDATDITQNITLTPSAEADPNLARFETRFILTGNFVVVTGTEGDDVIGVGRTSSSSGISPRSGATNNGDQIVARGGADFIRAGGGDDTIDGGAGNDDISGGPGDDTYVFAGAYGNDTITESDRGQSDVVQFGAGISSDQVQFFRAAASDVLDVRGPGGNGITIANQYDEARGTPVAGVETIQFADGAEIDLTSQGLTFTGTNGADQMGGTAFDDTLLGLNDADVLNGLAGNDTLDGGTGNDRLSGGAGNDTYVFSGAFGKDSIEEAASGGTDVISFGAGISATQVRFVASGSQLDLIVGANTISIDGQYNETTGAPVPVVERLDFANGDSVNLAGGLTFTGANTADVISGTSGSDQLIGLGGDDTLSGRGGDDRLDGGAGNDSLSGGAGDDVYSFAGAFGQDVIDEAADGGEDVIQFGQGISASQVRFTASEGRLDVIVGANTISIDGQYNPATGAPVPVIERIEFASGDPINLGGGMTFTGANAADAITGTSLNDTLVGLNGDDTLSGLAGDDSLDGGAGNDSLDGGVGDDVLNGGAGNDALVGGVGNDVYEFAPNFGNDAITEAAGGGQDVIRFDETVRVDQVQFFRADASELLTIRAGAAHSITVAGQFDGADGSPAAGVESIRFTAEGASPIDLTSQGLTFTGTNAADQMGGTAFADTLLGLSGDDLLRGLAGDDVLEGGAGNDSLIGGSGNDTYLFSGNFGKDVIEETGGGGGGDIIQFGAGITATQVRFVAAGSQLDVIVGANTISVDGQYNPTTGEPVPVVERIQFADGNSINLSEGLTFTGANAADTISGSSKNDVLLGLGGDDVLFGLVGNDVLEGGAGNDSLAGGAGDDAYDFAGRFGNDTIDETSGGGTDVIRFGDGITAEQVTFSNVEGQLTINVAGAGSVVVVNQYNPATGQAVPQVESIQFASGDEIDLAGGLTFTGTAGADSVGGTNNSDVLLGLGGDDAIRGLAGSDIASGGQGNDTVIGEAGDDLLLGGAGNDVLIGGLGDDTFAGGAGDDVYSDGPAQNDSNVYVVQSASGRELILDFDAGRDKIGLVDGDLTFADLAIATVGGATSQSAFTTIAVADTGTVLASISGITAGDLDEDSFTLVQLDSLRPDLW